MQPFPVMGLVYDAFTGQDAVPITLFGALVR